jgi:hypothetical protein
MPRVGFEPTSPAFERAKTFHATDRAATVIGPEEHGGRIKYVHRDCVSTLDKAVLKGLAFGLA